MAKKTRPSLVLVAKSCGVIPIQLSDQRTGLAQPSRSEHVMNELLLLRHRGWMAHRTRKCFKNGLKLARLESCASGCVPSHQHSSDLGLGSARSRGIR